MRSAPAARSGDGLTLRFGGSPPGGLQRVAAFFHRRNLAGLLLQAAEPTSGQIAIAIRDGHYPLHGVFLEDPADPPNRIEFNRDGPFRTNLNDGPATHALDLSWADFAIIGNGTVDDLAPSLVDFAVDILGPDGEIRQALTRAPGNCGFASLLLMPGTSSGL